MSIDIALRVDPATAFFNTLNASVCPRLTQRRRGAGRPSDRLSIITSQLCTHAAGVGGYFIRFVGDVNKMIVAWIQVMFLLQNRFPQLLFSPITQPLCVLSTSSESLTP